MMQCHKRTQVMCIFVIYRAHHISAKIENNVLLTLCLICVVIRLKHGIGADQDYFMLYHWYRKNKHDMNKFYKLIKTDSYPSYFTENIKMLALPVADI